MTPTPMPARRYLRRLAVAVVALLVVDRFVPGLLARAEAARYESDQLFRFEVSDLFTLGPLVGYLHEHPRGTRPRVAFFGDSIVWGYWLRRRRPSLRQFQRFDPAVRVLNFGVNGFETPSSYLIAKDAIDMLGALYVLDIGGAANPRLPEMITVGTKTARGFICSRPDSVESGLEHALAPWHLYTDAYRIQAALFRNVDAAVSVSSQGRNCATRVGRAVPDNPPPALTDLDLAAATIRSDRSACLRRAAGRSTAVARGAASVAVRICGARPRPSQAARFHRARGPLPFGLRCRSGGSQSTCSFRTSAS